MNINIEDYLSKEEIKEIIKEEVQKYVRSCIGNIPLSGDKSRLLIGQLAKTLAKDGVQELIPDFKDLINEHIKEKISKLELSDFFTQSMGWRSDGNKVFNGILSDNKSLIDAKIKEIFKLLNEN